MAYNSTSWTTDSLSKATNSTSTDDSLNISGTLTVGDASQLNSTLTVGVDDTGYDVKFFGATSGSFMLWDESDDALELTDSTPIKIGDGGDMTVYHDGSHSYITNSTGTMKLATETSGIAVSIGHTTSETTVNDNLTVTGTFNVTNDTAVEIQLNGSGNAANIYSDSSILMKAAASKTITFGTNNQTDTFLIDASENVTMQGDLSVVGADIVVGADADGTDRTIVFGHSTLKSIMGIDDSADRFVINTDASFDGTIADNDFSIDASGNAYVKGDLTVTGGRLTFGNAEYVVNETDNTLGIVSNGSGSGVVNLSSAGLTTVKIQSINDDTRLQYIDVNTIKWQHGFDYNDSFTFKWDWGTSTTGGATKLSLTSDGDLATAGDITVAGASIGTRASVTYLADNGSIPITATCVSIDANGSARTGIRFAGAGTAGQFIFVNNTGGEALTFHNTEGTALFRGINANHDTMESNFMGMFVSDGTYWNLIAGGIDSQPDVGLTAS